MKRIFFLAGLIAFFPMISMGVTNGDMIGLITTNSGKAYQNCRIFKIDPDGVFFAHSHGSAKILYVDMPDATRQQLGHDPVKAAEYSAEILAKQKKAREQQFELRKEVIKAQAFAQEVVRRSNEMQSSYPGNGYSPPLTDWVGTIPSFGWSASNNYPGEYAPGRSQNWSPVFNCNSNPNFQHDQYCRVPFHYDPRPKIDHHQYGRTAFNYDSRSNALHSQYGYATVNFHPGLRYPQIQYGSNRNIIGANYGNSGAQGRRISGGFAGNPAFNNCARPANGFFAVPALRNATPPLSVRPPTNCAVSRPVVSHH